MFGGSGNVGGDSVVSAAREAREERAAARRKEAAAIIIQANVRGFITRRKHIRNIREEFDSVLGQSTQASEQQPLPSPLEAYTKAAPLLRIYEKKKDWHRLHSYIRYIVTSLSSSTLQQRCIACALSQRHSLSWIQHVKQLLQLSCSTIQTLSSDVSSEGRLLSLHLHMLLGLTSTVTWPAVPSPLLSPLTKLTDNFLQHIVQRGHLYPALMQVLLRGLCRSKPVLRGPALGTVLTLALRPLPVPSPSVAAQQSMPQAANGSTPQSSSAPCSSELLLQFMLQVLSVPGVIHHLTAMVPESIVLLNKKSILEQTVNYLNVEQHLRAVFHTLEASYALCLLANIIHLMHHYVIQYNSKVKRKTPSAEQAESSSSSTTELLDVPSVEWFQELTSKFASVVRRLLEKCGEYVSNKQCNVSLATSSVTTKGASSQWHPVLGWFAQRLDQHMQDSFPYVRDQLHLLWSQPLLSAMFVTLSQLLPPHENDRPSPSRRGKGKSSGGGSAHPWSIRRIFDKKLSLVSSSVLSGRFTTDIQASNKLGSPEVQKVAFICSLYYLSMNTLSQLKMDILTGLCYKSSVVVQLWWLLQSLGNNCGLKTFLERLSQATKPTSAECHMVILFCDATAHLVTVLDDLELYEQQKPFSTADFTAIVIFLNTMCYRLISQGLVDCRHVYSCPLFSAAHSLLTLIFRRNSRRQLVTSENAWLINELKLSTFKDNLMDGNVVEQVLLQTLPHIVPHEERVLLFRANVAAQKATLSTGSSHNYTLITVFRSRIVEDGYRQLNILSPNALKGLIRVRFVNEQGLDEAGIDQDGVFKEFLEETLKKVLDPSLNLFKMNSENQLYPSPSSVLTENHLDLLEFTGKMLGKALYEGIVVDCPFAGFFLSQVIGEQQSALYSSIDQLPSLDPELYKNLTYVKHYEDNVEDLGLTFSYDEERLGEVVTHELRPAGKLLPVTNDNRIVYIHLMAHFKMHVQIREQTKAFVKGFRSIINPEWLAMFSIPELQRIISGDNVAIDLKDLRKHTQYYGGFHDSHRVVCWLWDILEKDLTAKEHSLFLKFVTSCSKPPLLGFQHLEPPFSIRCVEVGDDEDTGDTVGSIVRGFLAVGRRDPVHRLPTASTCFNLLKLPNYQKKSTLRSKLKYAINSNTGFELS